MSPKGSVRVWDSAVRRTGGRGFTFSEGGQWLCLGLWMQTAQLTKKQRQLRTAVRSAASLRSLTFPPLLRLSSAHQPPETLRSPINPGLDSHPNRCRLKVQQGVCFSFHSFVLTAVRCSVLFVSPHNATRISNGTDPGSVTFSNDSCSGIPNFPNELDDSSDIFSSFAEFPKYSPDALLEIIAHITFRLLYTVFSQ